MTGHLPALRERPAADGCSTNRLLLGWHKRAQVGAEQALPTRPRRLQQATGHSWHRPTRGMPRAPWRDVLGSAFSPYWRLMSGRISHATTLGVTLALQLSALALFAPGCDDAADGGRHTGLAGSGANAGEDEDSGTTPATDLTADAGSRSQNEHVDRSTLEPDTNPAIDAVEYAKLIQQLNQFGVDLGIRQAELNKQTTANNVYSPLSVAVALSMTYGGARTATAEEIRKLLAGDIPAETLARGVNRLSRELMSRELQDTSMAQTPKRIELSLADALYLESSLNVEDTFLDGLARNYDAGVHRVDFINAWEPARIEINDWVASQTHDRIEDLIPMGRIDSLTRFVLVNALYFYGSWLAPFDAHLTSDADFHSLDGSTVSVPTMHQGGSLRYAADGGVATVDLPYIGGHLSMAIVLPDAGQFEAVRKAMTGEWIEKTLGSLETAHVALALPKFKFTSGSFSLKDSLRAMGMRTAFTLDADFSGITHDYPLLLSDVLQKAFVAVDEAGTEAAAATAVIGTAGSAAPTDVIRFTVDRPFLFIIHDDTGAVLFTGHVVKPTL
jgi:serpin B